MNLIRTTAPADLPVDVDDVLDHLRLDDDAVDLPYVNQLVAAAVDRLDGPKGLLGRCLISQTWTLRLSSFAQVVHMPLPPTQAVVSVKFRNSAGILTTLDPPAYVVAGLGTDRATVRPASGTSWPTTADHPEAVEIAFVAGYGDTSAAVPGPIRDAIAEAVADRYAYRESVSAGAAFSRMPVSAQAALADFVDWGLIAAHREAER